MHVSPRISYPGVLACTLIFLVATTVAQAQQEFPPPQGKGRIVMMASGMSGPEHYTTVAHDVAQTGYDVVLFDGNAMENTHGEGVKSAIEKSQQAAHGLPGKVALVGFSLGGGESLYYGTPLSDQVAGVVVWYPATIFIKNIPNFVSRLQVPVLMFAGENDKFRNGCCTAEHAHELADAANAAGKPFELITYPKTDHDFVKDGQHYNAKSYADALEKTAAKLKEYLGN
jgi:alpha-beta hydrolase superfamily lysophospholipase